MFIRWIERPSKDGHDFTAMSAILAESKRVNGKPRQRHIAYLGGITDDAIEHLGSRYDFWNQVTAAFDKLDNQVTPSDRQRFETAIAARVPRPTADEHARVIRERAQHEREREEGMGDLMRRVLAFRLGNLNLHDFLSANASRCMFCGGEKDTASMVKGDTGAMICDACIAGLAKR